jgi:hypothetical protein
MKEKINCAKSNGFIRQWFHTTSGLIPPEGAFDDEWVEIRRHIAQCARCASLSGGIDCGEAQVIITMFLKNYISEIELPENNDEEIYHAVQHLTTCTNPHCIELKQMVQLEKYLTGPQMRIACEDLVKKWLI